MSGAHPPDANGAAPSSSIKILVVDDDREFQSLMEFVLTASGFLVTVQGDGTSALAAAERMAPDLALLDVDLRGPTTGLDVARRLRATSDLPIIFLTGASRPEDLLAGFDVGADDYLVKPFAMAELMARITALLRRAGRISSSVHRFADLVVDERRHEVWRGSAPITLTALEFRLLVALLRAPGTVVAKRQLLADVWAFDGFADNVVEVHMSALRKKLEAHGPRIIHTVRSVGYVLRGAVVAPAARAD